MATTHGKRFRALAEKVDTTKYYALNEAIELVKATSSAKFDESVDVTVVLGIDPKKGDQQVRGTITLPHGTGKTPRVVAIARGEAAVAAEEAGADAVGAEDVIAQIEKDELQFDVLVATPDMMRLLARLGKKLGPRMPNAKSGTVGPNLGQIVGDRKKGQIEYRNEPKAAVVHSIVGKSSFEPNALTENTTALITALNRAKPSSSKGTYLKSITLSSTMGPGVKVDTASLRA
ncbi:LSU ribosomal protein L1P [Abditibacterium utsteinense]|uniref:Large ribosomal subunit protein uL1 n=1 Tax=Abditibacterium utsteinense TaxID=1960156 RepID=A0A2S8SSZ1_9BACT|nr:50S ribosomal protein L1 [Abditibacterium utsteinense]PQV63896.1 LSU ribosomal protein L1P [Abditibacterium utsteinense]